MTTHQGMEILLVEDNPRDAELALRALEASHPTTRVTWLKDGAEALACFFGADGAPVPARSFPTVILLDLKLPKVDGLEVLRRIRANKNTRRLPVVILTSSKEEQDLAAGYDLGANSYVRKQVDFAQFDVAIKQLGAYWLALNEPPPKVRSQ